MLAADEPTPSEAEAQAALVEKERVRLFVLRAETCSTTNTSEAALHGNIFYEEKKAAKDATKATHDKQGWWAPR